MIDDLVSIACFVVAMFGLYFLWLTRRSGERRAPGSSPARRRDAPTGTGPADGPRLYKDVARDHRGHGDEDPPQYMTVDPPYGLGDSSYDQGVFKKPFRVAKPEKQQPRRDGIRLSDEANAELLRDIFGEEGPQC